MQLKKANVRGVSTITTKSKMGLFVTKVYGFKP